MPTPRYNVPFPTLKLQTILESGSMKKIQNVKMNDKSWLVNAVGDKRRNHFLLYVSVRMMPFKSYKKL